MTAHSRHLLALMLTTALATAGSASAQWINYPTPGLPRTADGKPNLTAPAPRMPDGTPDLSGYWLQIPGSYVVNMTQDLAPSDIQPWARQRAEARLDTFAKDDPACFLPSGPRYYITGPTKLVQSLGLLVMLNDDLTYRQVFLDGRPLPHDPNPSFMGYSVGRWDGDTLVVESTGFTDRTLLDTSGHPHSEALRITQRFHRVDVGHMDVRVTFEDPAIYAKPMTVDVRAQLLADDELIEFICRENEKDYEHITGRASDLRRPVPYTTLEKYVGRYVSEADGRWPASTVTVTLENGSLVIDRTPWLRDRHSLIATSETSFVGHFGLVVRFETDDRGRATSILFLAPEPGINDIRARRQP